MRVFRLELYRFFYDWIYYIYFFLAMLLGFAFSLLNVHDLRSVVHQIFGSAGYMYGALCSMAVICTFVGKDFSYRTIHNKISTGGKRESLLTATFLCVSLCEIPVIVIFPASSILSAGILSGWGTQLGKDFLFLICSPSFLKSILAYVIGIMGFSAACILITIACRDMAKSLGLSTAYIIVCVMMTQKIFYLDSLQKLRQFISIIPLYQMLANIREGYIDNHGFQAVVFCAAIWFLAAYILSLLLFRFERLK